MGSVPAARARRVRAPPGSGWRRRWRWRPACSPHRHRHVGLDAAAGLRWPVHARPRHAGERTRPPAVRDGSGTRLPRGCAARSARTRAVWRCWQNGEPLQFESEHYDLSLMVPLFDPGPIDHPDIPIHIAAIGPNMCGVAGEIANGVRLHPICTTRFIDESVKPAVERGAGRRRPHPVRYRVLHEAARRNRARRALLPPARVSETVRARVVFDLSTPAYRRLVCCASRMG